MVHIPAGTIIIESGMLYSMNNESLLELYDLLNKYDVFKSEEIGYTLVETVNNRRLYISLGVNSLFIHGDRELYNLLKQNNVKYYINLKSIWIKACKLRQDMSIRDLLRKVIRQLRTIEHEKCIYVDSSGNISDSPASDIRLQICHNIVDRCNIVSLKPYHPIAYGVLSHSDVFDEKYTKVLKEYLRDIACYDTLAYVIMDENYKSFIDVNDVKRFVKINLIPEKIDLFRLLINAILYILCI